MAGPRRRPTETVQYVVRVLELSDIDTLKNDNRYRRFLKNCTWDVVWIDEAHNVANQNTDRNRQATLANRCHGLILTSATPHNGKPVSFATLLRILDPTSVADPEKITPDEI